MKVDIWKFSSCRLQRPIDSLNIGIVGVLHLILGKESKHMPGILGSIPARRPAIVSNLSVICPLNDWRCNLDMTVYGEPPDIAENWF